MQLNKYSGNFKQKKKLEEIIKDKSWFFRKINKIDIKIIDKPW